LLKAYVNRFCVNFNDDDDYDESISSYITRNLVAMLPIYSKNNKKRLISMCYMTEMQIAEIPIDRSSIKLLTHGELRI
jgi:hypothetical protein